MSSNERISNDTPKAENGQRSCAQWEALFEGLNEFFREEDILQGSEHSSVWIGYIYRVCYLLVIAFGAFGNLMTILAVLRNKQMRTVRNFFIVNLALSDFFVCTVTAPTTLYTVLYVFWPFGMTLCKIAGSLQGFNIFLSTFSITAIALDRYVLVIFPTKRQRQQRLSLVFFSLIWLSSILLAAPLFLAADLNSVFRDAQCGIALNLCNEQNERWKELPLSKEAYTLGVIILQYAFPLAAIVFAYSRIARRMGARKARGGSGGGRGSSCDIRKGSAGPTTTNIVQTVITNSNSGVLASHMNGAAAPMAHRASSPAELPKMSMVSVTANGGVGAGYGGGGSLPNAAEILISQRRKSVADRHRRTNMLLVTLVVVFACAWLPLNIFHLVNTFSRSVSFSVPIFALCHLIAMCSACLNPCCYAFFNQNFRQEFLDIYRKLGLIWIFRHIRRFVQLLHFRSRAGAKCSPPSLLPAGDRRLIVQTRIVEQQQRGPQGAGGTMAENNRQTSALLAEQPPGGIGQ